MKILLVICVGGLAWTIAAVIPPLARVAWAVGMIAAVAVMVALRRTDHEESRGED